MNEEKIPSQPEQLLETPKLGPLPRNDWLLQNLVSFANEIGVESGVTLQVGGMLVSGTIISIDKYLEEFSTLFEGGFKNDAELGGQLGELIKSWKPERPQLSPDETPSGPPPQMVHLRNARFFFPGQRAFPAAHVLWRGRLSEVGGFFLGLLSDADQKE
jgi:hypothetical protein